MWYNFIPKKRSSLHSIRIFLNNILSRPSKLLLFFISNMYFFMGFGNTNYNWYLIFTSWRFGDTHTNLYPTWFHTIDILKPIFPGVFQFYHHFYEYAGPTHPFIYFLYWCYLKSWDTSYNVCLYLQNWRYCFYR
jgi:hypothetical protein